MESIILEFLAAWGRAEIVIKWPAIEDEKSKAVMQRLVRIAFIAGCALLAACDKNTPLMEKVIADDTAAASALIAQGADVNARNNYGWTALSHAARSKNAELVRLLLEHGADANARDESGWTPLMRAAMKGNVEAAQALLEHGASVNVQEKAGWTALHWAASQGHDKLVALLLSHGADPKLRTEDGWTPLMVAMKEGNEEVAQVLQRAGVHE